MQIKLTNRLIFISCKGIIYTTLDCSARLCTLVLNQLHPSGHLGLQHQLNPSDHRTISITTFKYSTNTFCPFYGGLCSKKRQYLELVYLHIQYGYTCGKALQLPPWLYLKKQYESRGLTTHPPKRPTAVYDFVFQIIRCGLRSAVTHPSSLLCWQMVGRMPEGNINVDYKNLAAATIKETNMGHQWDIA